MEDVKSMLKTDAPKHAEQGLILRHIWRNMDDPDEILFIFTTPDLNSARKYIEIVHTEIRKENPNAKLPQLLFLKGE